MTISRAQDLGNDDCRTRAGQRQLAPASRTTALLAAALVVAGCATTPAANGWSPTVDPQGLNRTRYERDLAECRAHVEANPETDGARAAKRGALRMGAGTAAIVGVGTLMTGGLALLPLAAGSIAATAGVGAAAGGGTAHQAAESKYRAMLTACLAGRGHKVLG